MVKRMSIESFAFSRMPSLMADIVTAVGPEPATVVPTTKNKVSGIGFTLPYTSVTFCKITLMLSPVNEAMELCGIITTLF